MSWVVPPIAAELLGVSLEHVLSQIRAGALAAREEFGFTWVDVSIRGNARPNRVRRWGRRGRPHTYTRRPAAPLVPDTPSVVEPSIIGTEELQALGVVPPPVELQVPTDTPEPVTGGCDAVPQDAGSIAGDCATPPEPAAIEPPEPDECESPEDADDGVPMNWRQARAKATSMRRRPPGSA